MSALPGGRGVADKIYASLRYIPWKKRSWGPSGENRDPSRGKRVTANLWSLLRSWQLPTPTAQGRLWSLLVK